MAGPDPRRRSDLYAHELEHDAILGVDPPIAAPVLPEHKHGCDSVNAAGSLDLTDYGEARFRAGYVVGNLLPYGFIGMAVGRASYSVSTIAVVAQA